MPEKKQATTQSTKEEKPVIHADPRHDSFVYAEEAAAQEEAKLKSPERIDCYWWILY